MFKKKSHFFSSQNSFLPKKQVMSIKANTCLVYPKNCPEKKTNCTSENQTTIYGEPISQISTLANHPAFPSSKTTNQTPPCSSINTAIASHPAPKSQHPNGAQHRRMLTKVEQCSNLVVGTTFVIISAGLSLVPIFYKITSPLSIISRMK